MSFDPNLLHNNGHNGYSNGISAALRETGVIEKLLTSYGFIQCSEQQARLFFHCSQYNGNLQDLKVGDDVELEVSSDRWTGKPIAIKLVKIKPEIHPEERMNGQEVFYLTYTSEAVEGNAQLETGDKINFVIDNNKHWCSNHDKEIFFHYSEFSGDGDSLELGDMVEYSLSKGKGNKVSAEKVNKTHSVNGSTEEANPTIYSGKVIHPLRGVDPTQIEYQRMIETVEEGDMKGDSKKLFLHVKEVQDGIELQAADEAEFSVILNRHTGKSSACNAWRVCEGPKAVAAPRSDRLVNRLKNISLDDASAPRLMVLRQPRGPDNSMGFGAERKIRQAGVID
ncbi:cold shock domain-containing protein E1-like protein [Cricetulus griseus]|nr:cold shock domain-containing protein E1-like protein [Cricetulus griseus]